MFNRKRSHEDFAEEIQAHLELEAEELRREGMSDEEARRRSRIAFGNVQRAQERFVLRGRFRWFDDLWRDIYFAVRQLRKNISFAVISIAILTVGMGASVALFGFVDAALLQPLPYGDPNLLMSVNESSVASARWPLSYPDYLDWQRLNHSFTSMDVYSGRGYLLHTVSGTEPIQAERVTGGFFHTLGIRPVLGRDFAPGENRPGGPDVVLLSYQCWRDRFHSRPGIVGSAVDLDDRAYTVIGVLPRSFSFAPSGNAEFWVPLNSFTPHEKQRTFYNNWGIGRLRDGVSVGAAGAEMKTIAAQLQRQYGVAGRGLSASVLPLSEVFVGDARPILLTLLGGAALLLLIACTNVANLMLVRSESRRREVAVRSALGATPLRLASQFVVEGLLLAAMASIAGVTLATAMVKVLTLLVPKGMASTMPFLKGAGIHAHTAVFAASIGLLAALLLAATPVVRLSFQRIREGLAEGDRGSAGRIWQRMGAGLVVVELTVAVVLLTGAGLLGRSLYRLLHVPLGFSPDHVATLQVQVSGKKYEGDEQTANFHREVERQLLNLPGVESVGMTSVLPAQCDCSTDAIQIMGRPSNDDHNEVDERHVSAGYLPALKAPLLQGRFFTEDDSAQTPGVTVINEALARKYFSGTDPMGKRLVDNEQGQQAVWEIVGVVGDLREGPLDADIAPSEYFPLNQTKEQGFNLVVRSRQDAGALLPHIVERLHRMDPDLGISDEATMEEKIGTTQAALLHRAAAWLVGGFAVTALVLGAAGLYGVVSHTVAQRTREIAVRMALGAQRSSVYGMVLRQAAWLAGTGVAFGVAASMASSVLIRKLLFGVQAWDPLTLGSVAGVLALASIAASFLPARRAASVNPVEALRVE